MSEVDYRGLLKRYIDHIVELEGTRFFETSRHLSEQDVAELNVLDGEPKTEARSGACAMKPTDEELALVRGAIYAHCHDFENEDAAARKAWDVIAPLVLKRAARELEESWDDGAAYFAEVIRGLAKPTDK